MKFLIVFITTLACAQAFVPKLYLIEEEKEKDNFFKIPKINLFSKAELDKAFKYDLLTDLFGHKLDAKSEKLPLADIIEVKKEELLDKKAELKHHFHKHNDREDDCFT